MMTDSVLGLRHSRLDAPLPRGACDCHVHVFGPPDRFPFDPGRTYTPGVADVDALSAHQRALGLDRVVIVQPTPYGTDNRCTLDAVRRLGEAARAVAVIGPDQTASALQELHQAGVRGVRINLETVGQHDPVIAGRLLREAADRVAPLGWHVQVYTNVKLLASLHRDLTTLPAPLVVDHFGRAMAAPGPRQPGFDALLDLVRTGRAWVKLSAAHRIAAVPDDAGPLAAALIAANPARMLWGSDWPHPGGRARTPAERTTIEEFNPVDDGQALNRLRRWAGEAATLRMILVDNPARLYGFPQGLGEMAMIGRRQLGLAALALPMLGRPARAEVSTVRIAKQYGLPYLPIMVMEHERLVEKHAARLGLPALQTAWATLGGTGAIADGLISGQLDFAGAGANALLTLWDKTAGTGQEVLALSAIQSMPFLLMTSSTALHSVDDLSDADRIAVPAVKISAQALLLEMEAARRWGLDDYARLDRLTVSLPHPDALVGLLSGTSAVNCHYAVSPFYYYELASPKLRMILKSYDTFGSHHINGTLIGSKRFRDANPKVTEAVLAAQEEANELLNKHPDQAAAIYIEMAKDTRSSPAEMARMVADPDNDWTTTPAGVERMADFMQKTGRMRRTLTSWKQVYMPEVHGVAGS